MYLKVRQGQKYWDVDDFFTSSQRSTDWFLHYLQLSSGLVQIILLKLDVYQYLCRVLTVVVLFVQQSALQAFASYPAYYYLYQFI